MKFFFLIGVLALALVATLVANWSLQNDIERCGRLADSAARLTCFDRLVADLGLREEHDRIGR